MKREDTKTKVNDPMSTVPTKPRPYLMNDDQLRSMVEVGDKQVDQSRMVGAIRTRSVYEPALSELAEQLEEARGLIDRRAKWYEDAAESRAFAHMDGFHIFCKSVSEELRAFLSRTSPTDPTPPEK